MTADAPVKTLVKILIGAAWIDGHVQPEERDYLQRVIREKGLSDDPEIQPLLQESGAVDAEECYGWVREYLGDRPSTERCQQLIDAISGLIYSDGTVATEEAKLLTNLLLLDPAQEPTATGSSVLGAVRNLYQRWMAKLNP